MSAAEANPSGPTLPRWTYLGASDIAAVIGLRPSRYSRTALDVWAEKVHRVTTEDNPRMLVGRTLERPVLMGLYAEPRGLALDFPGTLRNRSEPWMGATPDALAGTAPPHRDDGIDPGWISDRGVECKIIGARQMRRWGDPEQGADGVPEEVFVQTTWQLATLHANGAKLEIADAVALLGTELRVYRLEYDAEFAADLMEVGRTWWRRHVEGGVMPEVTETSKDTLARIFRRPIQGMLAMTEDVRDHARGYLRALREEKIAEHTKAYHAAELCARIGDASGFEGEGIKATWLTQRGRVSYKDIVDALGVPETEREEYRGDPIRVLRVTGDEDDGE